MPRKTTRKPPPMGCDGFRLNIKAAPIAKVAEFLSRNIGHLPLDDRDFASSLATDARAGRYISSKQAGCIRRLAAKAHERAA